MESGKEEPMDELVKVLHNDIFTDSLVIAEGTGIAHRKIKDAIRKYQDKIQRFGLLTSYQAESTGGRPEEYYYLNEEQATFLITLLKNTDIVVEFKLALVHQFYAMRQRLLERQSLRWQQTRLESKAARRLETEEIKEFIQYARDSGSKSAEKYYIHFSKLANKAVGLDGESREVATVSQLNNLVLVENIINNGIREGMRQQEYYKDIYKACKERIEQFRQIAYWKVA